MMGWAQAFPNIGLCDVTLEFSRTKWCQQHEHVFGLTVGVWRTDEDRETALCCYSDLSWSHHHVWSVSPPTQGNPACILSLYWSDVQDFSIILMWLTLMGMRDESLQARCEPKGCWRWHSGDAVAASGIFMDVNWSAPGKQMLLW